VEFLKELIVQLVAKINKVDLTFDLAAAAIAVIALYFSIRARRGQRQLSVEALRLARDNDIIQWSNSAINTIVAVEFLLRGVLRGVGTGSFAVLRDECLSKLSASIDKGRLYFPNFEHDSHGAEKEAAFRGIRQPILDRLVEIYDLVKDIDANVANQIEAVRQPLMSKKRAFVSEVQSAVDPRRRHSFIVSQS
jgi:hypothetical protein